MKPTNTIQERAGAEIRSWRLAAELSQQSLSDLFGTNRDAMSKMETGKTNITLHDYLTIVMFLREVIPEGHPALALADQLLQRRIGRTRRV